VEKEMIRALKWISTRAERENLRSDNDRLTTTLDRLTTTHEHALARNDVLHKELYGMRIAYDSLRAECDAYKLVCADYRSMAAALDLIGDRGSVQ
jgi:hypothetical protein